MALISPDKMAAGSHHYVMVASSRHPVPYTPSLIFGNMKEAFFATATMTLRSGFCACLTTSRQASALHFAKHGCRGRRFRRGELEVKPPVEFATGFPSGIKKAAMINHCRWGISILNQ